MDKLRRLIKSQFKGNSDIVDKLSFDELKYVKSKMDSLNSSGNRHYIKSIKRDRHGIDLDTGYDVHYSD